MKVSFAITVKDELTELKRLLGILIPYKAQGLDTEIVVLYDSKNGSKEVKEYLTSNMGADSDSVYYYLYNYPFEGDFAAMKNTFNKICKGDFIFQIDADEYPNETLLRHLPMLLQEPDLIFIPRWNTVEGITEQHVKQWNWKLDAKGRVNWPDHQGRIYRNSPDIQWKGKVHERIQGHKSYSVLEDEFDMYLIHPKTIQKQEQQNKFYQIYQML